MMRLRAAEERATYSLSQYLELLNFDGHQYLLPSTAVPLNTSRLDPPQVFGQYVQTAYRGNGVIGAAVAARAYLMSQLRFRWRRPDGTTFTTADLDAFNRPKRVRRSLLLNQAERHVSCGGAAYFVRQNRIEPVMLLRPDWCSLLFGSQLDPGDAVNQHDCDLIGLVYRPGGSPTAKPTLFKADEFVQWAPEPDPTCWWTGSSWVQALLEEVLTARQATDFTAKFFKNGATPQVMVSLDPSVTKEQASGYAEMIQEKYGGAQNAYKTMVLGGGATPHVVGADLKAISMREIQGLIETRISVRSRVPAVVLSIAEGLGGSALNAGNYQQTRRLWGDGWFSPHAQDLCAAIAPLLRSPGDDVELTFDPTMIEFLQEDRKDEAEIRSKDAITARQLVDGGFDPDSVTAYINTNDVRVLKHTGNLSVQLQPPGAAPAATSN